MFLEALDKLEFRPMNGFCGGLRDTMNRAVKSTFLLREQSSPTASVLHWWSVGNHGDDNDLLTNKTPNLVVL